MTRVLITGAGGMVGSEVLKYLHETTDWEFVCVCSWKHKGTPEKVIKSERVEVITHDLISPLTARTIAHIGHIDYILNIASESHVDRSIEDPVGFTQNNVNLVLNMLELARELKPKKFIQFSTDEVYGVAPEGTDHAEWSPIVPSNPYAASKAAQEAIAVSYWRTYGVPVVITNTMNIFSEAQDWEKFIPLCVKKIMNGEKITIHGTPDGKPGSRYYIHAQQVAEALKFILDEVDVPLYPDAERPERLNIVGEEEVDNLTLAQRVADYLDKDWDYEVVSWHGSRPGHDLRYALDGSKLANYGWKPENTMSTKLKETVLALKDMI